LKALVRRNGLKLGHDGFPYRVGTARIRRWAGFIDEPESSKESRLRAWSVLRQLRSVLSEAGNVAIPPAATATRRLNLLFKSGYRPFWTPVYSSKITSGG